MPVAGDAEIGASAPKSPPHLNCTGGQPLAVGVEGHRDVALRSFGEARRDDDAIGYVTSARQRSGLLRPFEIALNRRVAARRLRSSPRSSAARHEIRDDSTQCLAVVLPCR
jgi:hypothetical protein